MTYGNSATWTCLVSVVFPIPCVFSTRLTLCHSKSWTNKRSNLAEDWNWTHCLRHPSTQTGSADNKPEAIPCGVEICQDQMAKCIAGCGQLIPNLWRMNLWSYDQISSWFEHVWMAGIQIPNMGQGICTEIKWIQTRSYRLYLEACFPSRCFLHLLIHVSFWRISCRYFTSTIARIQLWHCNPKGSSTKSPLTKSWNHHDRYVRRNDLLATLLFEAPQAPSCMSWPRLRRKPVAGTQASCQKKPNMSQANLHLFHPISWYFHMYSHVVTPANLSAVIIFHSQEQVIQQSSHQIQVVQLWQNIAAYCRQGARKHWRVLYPSSSRCSIFERCACAIPLRLGSCNVVSPCSHGKGHSESKHF